jgi:hypothetical protein
MQRRCRQEGEHDGPARFGFAIGGAHRSTLAAPDSGRESLDDASIFSDER